MLFRSKFAIVLIALIVGVGSFYGLKFFDADSDSSTTTAAATAAEMPEETLTPAAPTVSANLVNKADSGVDLSVLKGMKAVVYKSPSCGCCKNWEKYLTANGMQVEPMPVDDLNSIKAKLKVPRDLSSCHTAVINGYVVEGHVPLAAIAKMIQQKLPVKGIAVPGMPIGSPGMEGFPVESYDVIAFSEEKSGQPGQREVILKQ